ncbi:MULTISPECIES: hypothetical protein [Serratia]|uniref:hypothetical protein n=1 Tax=Serratia TaxID=613 RepID=UPI0006672A67|nr:hypothetical protein [Serratia marcescens]MBN5204955.1 hypothetical protein [Serratia marcescens]CAI2459506.1 Uncharacterised protein [Serratia marcescens]CAI2781586.1 Uncharacterised protein [Serratia marcescens]
MNREEIIEAIASASELSHREGRDIFASRIYSMIETGKIPGVMLATTDVQQLMQENKAMRKAIAFAISPGIWIQREDEIFQYCGGTWYAEILKQSICKDNKLEMNEGGL